MTVDDSQHIGRCAGCGIELQQIDPTRVGFIPQKALQHDPKICQRCFRLKNYN